MTLDLTHFSSYAGFHCTDRAWKLDLCTIYRLTPGRASINVRMYLSMRCNPIEQVCSV